MMGNKKTLGVVGWILSVVVFLALINWGTLAWFDFDLIDKLTFDIAWLAKTVYTIVAVLGVVGLINLIMKTFK